MNKGYQINRTKHPINDKGDVRQQWEAIDGIRHGYCKIFYDNGNVFRYLTFDGGVQCGYASLGNPDGSLNLISTVYEKKFEGEAIDFIYEKISKPTMFEEIIKQNDVSVFDIDE
jgi:antitoxin component YwqK of YwqJK toxin-antitoxin module